MKIQWVPLKNRIIRHCWTVRNHGVFMDSLCGLKYRFKSELDYKNIGVRRCKTCERVLKR